MVVDTSITSMIVKVMITTLAVFSFSILRAEAGPDEVRLIKDLFENYTSLERPSEITSEPLQVDLKVTLRSIIDLVEKDQTIITMVWLEYYWNDYKLRWKEEDYGNISVIEIPPKYLWKPDVLMYNSADPEFDQSYPVNVLIRSNGDLSQNPPAIFTSSCSVNIRWFPFDDQNCDMMFGTWSYDGSKISLKLKDGVEEASLEGYSKSGEWDLLGVPAKRNIITYQCCPDNPYIDITYTIKIRRRKLYYVVNIIIPCLMLAALTLVTFTIPPDAGEKISFGVTILLSLTVFLLMVAEALPASSDAVPLIALYFSAVMFLNAFSVVFTILVLNYHHRTSDTHTMPRWVKKFICEWLAWILRIDRPGHEFRCELRLPCTDSKVTKIDCEMIENSNCKSLLLRGDDPIKIHEQRHKIKKQPTLQPPAEFTPARAELRAILRELRFITEKMKSQDEEDQITKDWKFAATVIDRFLLWFFTIATVLASFIILLSAPEMFSQVDTH